MLDFIFGVIGFVVSLVIGLIIMVIPTGIALYKKQENAKQIMSWSILVFVVGVLLGCVCTALGGVLPFLGIIGWVFDILSLAAWVYMLICAITNKPMTLVEKINLF